MSEIKVNNGNIEDALKRFKRQCARNGVLQEVRKREHYEKPSITDEEKENVENNDFSIADTQENENPALKDFDDVMESGINVSVVDVKERSINDIEVKDLADDFDLGIIFI